ncbi:MAG: ferritin-like domain-containing protein [Bacteroidota bacterium]
MHRFRSSIDWREVFARNATAPRPIPWNAPVRWTPDERSAIAASIQEFQLGEQSEGHTLRRCAKRYAARTGDTAYPDAMRLFIDEEARHAAELARLLTSAGERLKTHTPLDSVFRRLRKLGLGDGLEVCLRVLVTAEVVALLYYAALRDATRCPVTQALCAQILRDEAAHVRFHAERLAQIQASRSRLHRHAVRSAHRGLMLGTASAVWLGVHRHVLRRGGLTARAFVSGCVRTLNRRVLRVDETYARQLDPEARSSATSELQAAPIPR